MKSRNLVTLLVLGLVALMTAAVVPAQATQPSGALCHVPPGNPENAHVIPADDPSWQAHFAHGDFVIDANHPCPPVVVTPEPTDEVTPEPTEEVTPEPTEEVTPTPEETEEPCSDCETPNPTPTPIPTIVVEEPARPVLLQITVWPDNTNGQTASVTGFTWTVNGSEIYVDANGNGARDISELPVVTGVEYRNRPVCEGGVAVDGQVMSRLVLGITLEDIPNGDLDTFLSGFTAYINGVPVLDGWYDVGGEFAPCADDYGFSLTGAVQQRVGGEIIARQPE